MEEKRTNFYTVEKTILCDKCKDGTMIYLDTDLLDTNNPIYKYKCNKCNHHATTDKQYPIYELKPMSMNIEDDLTELYDDVGRIENDFYNLIFILQEYLPKEFFNKVDKEIINPMGIDFSEEAANYIINNLD